MSITIIPKSLFIAGPLGFLSVLLTSCDLESQNMSQETETLRLTAEKAAIEAKLQAVITKLKKAESVIISLKTEISNLKKQQVSTPTPPKHDFEIVKLGFMNGVDKLRENIETSNPSMLVQSVTMGKVNASGALPFSSAITMQIQSRSTGKSLPFKWIGRGSPDGNWTFEKVAQSHEKTNNLADHNAADQNSQNNTPQTIQDKGIHHISWPKAKNSTKPLKETITKATQQAPVSNPNPTSPVKAIQITKVDRIINIPWPEENPNNKGTNKANNPPTSPSAKAASCKETEPRRTTHRSKYTQD